MRLFARIGEPGNLPRRQRTAEQLVQATLLQAKLAADVGLPGKCAMPQIVRAQMAHDGPVGLRHLGYAKARGQVGSQVPVPAGPLYTM